MNKTISFLLLLAIVVTVVVESRPRYETATNLDQSLFANGQQLRHHQLRNVADNRPTSRRVKTTRQSTRHSTRRKTTTQSPRTTSRRSAWERRNDGYDNRHEDNGKYLMPF